MRRAGPTLLLLLGLLGPGAARAEEEDASARYQPSMAVVDQHGRRLRFYDDLIRGRVALINFMFTSCTSICPPMTQNLVRVQRLLGASVGREVVMLSVTVDPEVDTPEVLRRYAERHGVGPGWYFLTAPPQELRALLAKLGNSSPEKARHSGLLVLGNDATRTWTRMQAQAAPEDIAQAVRRLAARRGPHGRAP